LSGIFVLGLLKVGGGSEMCDVLSGRGWPHWKLVRWESNIVIGSGIDEKIIYCHI